MAADCPVCSSPVDPDGRWIPFCSERCRLVDLDRWLTGQYRIPGPPVDPEPRDDDTAADPAIRSGEEA